MANASFSRPRAIAFALLATTAAAALLGGCTKTGLPLPRFAGEQKLAPTDAVGAVAQYSAAYAKKPNDPNLAMGYAQALKSIGSRDRALDVLTAGYRANPDNGQLAAELGRLALDMGRLDIASQTLKVAEAQGLKDWKTLSAQGTLRARKGNHAEAQQYFLAALKDKPDALSVTNNLALSYALDGKADESEAVLRKAIASGHADKRTRQNLALVLGLQGKFDEARNVASKDMTEEQAQASLAYLRNMLSSPTQVAGTQPAEGGEGEGEDWMPFAAANPGAPSRTATVAPAASPQVHIVKASEQTAAPAATVQATATPSGSTAALAKPSQVAGTPILVTPSAMTAKAKTARASTTQATTTQVKTTQADPDRASGEQTGSF
jgi:Flp pilus assembly protein TadD